MTTPDIEKLRMLAEKWRNVKTAIGNRGQKRPLTDNERDVSRVCADELESAGLAELLDDYERLLRVEKLRMLPQAWRDRLNKCVGYPVCDGDLPGEEHDPKCPEYGRPAYTPIRIRDCIADLESALPELLADYERLLRERITVGPNIYRDPDTGTLSILGTTATGAEQPPAVSEEHS